MYLRYLLTILLISLLAASLPSYTFFLSTASISGGLCQALGLGELGKCNDISLYAVGVAESSGLVLGYPVEVLLAVTPGSGSIFVSAEPLVDDVFMLFSRVAALVASVSVGKRYTDFNYYILVKAPTARVAGPSLSAALAVGFALAILNTSVEEPIAVTGILMPDGGIGPVDRVAEKVLAATRISKKIFVPAGQRSSAWSNGTRVDLVELGGELGVEVIEVSTIHEVLKYLGVVIPPTISRDHARSSLMDFLVRSLFEYLTATLGDALKEFGENCGEVDANISLTTMSRDAPPESLARSVLQLMSTVVKIGATSWVCRIKSGRLGLEELVSKALTRLKASEDACHLYSEGTSLVSEYVVAISYSCLMVLDAKEDLEISFTERSLEDKVYRLVRSSLMAGAAYHVLNQLDHLPTTGAIRELDPRRLQAVREYAEALLNSFEYSLLDTEYIRKLRDYLLKVDTAPFNQLLSLVYTVRALSGLTSEAYSTLYGVSPEILLHLRARALKYLSVIEDPTLVVIYVVAGDHCIESGRPLAECVDLYTRASAFGFLLYYTPAIAKGTRQGYRWYWLLAVVVGVIILLALLLRRGRGFPSRLP